MSASRINNPENTRRGGRPKGSRNKRTVLCERLLEPEAEAIIKTVIRKAKEGDAVAMKLAVERIYPPPKGRLVNFPMPEVKSVNEISRALGAVLRAVSRGQLTTDEGVALSRILGEKVEAIQTVELERRIVALEKSRGNT